MMTLESKLNLLNIELSEVDEMTVEENRKRIEREYPGLLEFNPREEYAYSNSDHRHMTINTHRLEVGRIVF